MKKITLILILIIFLSVITPSAFVLAISGACSSHNGVNCSVGADINGNVRCNDGWVNSSVSFYNTDECMNDKHLCTDSGYKQLILSSNLDSLKSKIDELTTQSADLTSQLIVLNNLMQAEQLANEGKGVPMNVVNGRNSEVVRQYSLKINPLLAQLDSVKSDISSNKNEYNSKLSSINQQCLSMGDQEWLNQQSAIFNQQQKDTQDSLNSTIQQIKASSCQTNSHYNSADGKCYCDVGYASSGSACVSADKWCHDNLGVNSYSSSADNKCYCKTGYQFNASQTNCVATPLPTTTPVKPTNQNITPPVIAQKTIEKNYNPPTNTITIEKTTEAQIQPQSQAQPKPQTKSKNIFSNIWDFIKNIFK